MTDLLCFEREWAMPSAWTFSILPIGDLVAEEVANHPGLWIDPFCGKCSPATVKNDLNPDIEADYHLEALDFLRQFQDESVDGAIFDPPYSLRQVSECYHNYGAGAFAKDISMAWASRCKDEVARIIKPTGKAICCGWNSNGLGKQRGFVLERLLLVHHGGSKNDTIVTVECKLQRRLMS